MPTRADFEHSAASIRAAGEFPQTQPISQADSFYYRAVFAALREEGLPRPQVREEGGSHRQYLLIQNEQQFVGFMTVLADTREATQGQILDAPTMELYALQSARRLKREQSA